MRLLLLGKAGLAQRWSPKEILWVKPPWDLWTQAAAKLLASQCTIICVVPALAAEWVRSLVHTATRRLYVEMGTRLYQRNGKKCAGPRWTTWLLRIDGDVHQRLDDKRAYNAVCHRCGDANPLRELRRAMP